MTIRGHNLLTWIALAGCGAAVGCVTEYGRPKPALWTSVDNNDETPQSVKLKRPGRMHLIAGKVAEKRQLHGEARKHYKAVLAEDGNNLDAILGLARLDQHAGRIGSARKGFDRAMQLAPRNHEVLDSAGMFYASQNQLPRAISMLQQAVAQAPDDKDHRFHLGVVMAKAGNYNAAMPHFVAAVGRPRAHYHMGYLLYEQGRTDDAIREFQIALSLQPQLDEARTMLSRLGIGQPQQRQRQQYAANRRPPVQDRRPMNPRPPIQSVGHTEPPNDLGTQSAWQRTTPHRIGTPQDSDSNDGPTIIPGPVGSGSVAAPNTSGSFTPGYAPAQQPVQQPTGQGIVIPPAYPGNAR